MARTLRRQSSQVLLLIVVLLLGANLVVHFAGDAAVTHAMAPVTAANGIPDSGAQFQAVVDEVRATNKRLDTLQAFLESGNLTVKAKIEKDDKDAK